MSTQTRSRFVPRTRSGSHARPQSAAQVADRKKRFDEYQKEVKRLAYGNWDRILISLAGQVLGAAIEAGPLKHVPCPVHGGKNGDAFRCLNDFRLTGGMVCNSCGARPDGFSTLMWLYQWDFIRAIKEVGEALGKPYGEGFKPAAAGAPKVQAVEFKAKVEDPAEVARRDERNAKKMTELWLESFPLLAPESAIARMYLKNRAISKVFGTLDDIRFHPAVSYWENGTDLGEHPCMIRLLRQANGEPLSIERLYLTPDGRKADLEKVKKIMPYRSTATFHGSAVRLDHEVGTVLCVAEGVETALSYRAMLGLPTWATTFAGLMETLVIPAQAELVIIAADLDPPHRNPKGEMVPGRGQEAAEILAERIRKAGRRVAITMPPFEIPQGLKKLDWNDVLQTMGIDAAREHAYVRKTRARVAQTLKEMGYDWDSTHAHY